MRIEFSVSRHRCVGFVFLAVCVLQHYRLLDHRTVYRREWVQLSERISVYSAYRDSESTVVLAAVDPPGHFDNIVCFHETPALRHITFTTMHLIKDTERSNLAILKCPLAIPPGDHVGLRAVGSDKWSRMHVEDVRPHKPRGGVSPAVCFLQGSWFFDAEDDFTFEAHKALKWTNPLLGSGVDCFFRMQIQTEWIVSANSKTEVFDDRADVLAKLSRNKVYVLDSCADLSLVLFHRSVVDSDSKSIVQELLSLNNTKLC